MDKVFKRKTKITIYFSISGMKIRTTLRFCFTQVKMTKIKKTTDI